MNMSHSIMKIYCDYLREYRKTFVWVHTCCLLWMWEPVSGFYLFYFGQAGNQRRLTNRYECNRNTPELPEKNRNYPKLRYGIRVVLP